MQHLQRFLPLLLFVGLIGCVADPDPVDGPPNVVARGGVVVVNEGVWGSDNGTLTRIDPESGRSVTDWFAAANPGRRLGDLANAIALLDGRGWIAVTGSRSIEGIDLVSGKSLGRLDLGGQEPRELALLDSTTGYVTTLSDSLLRFDPLTFHLEGGVPVGPAPEGVAISAGRIFVANSGFGRLRQGEPGAGTVSVLDVAMMGEQRRIPVGPNPRFVLARGRTLYVGYGMPEEEGGVAEIDAGTLSEGRRWRIDDLIGMAIDGGRGELYAIGAKGLFRIDLASGEGGNAPLVPLSRHPGRLLYAVGVDEGSGAVYVTATEGYRPLPGVVLEMDRRGEVVASYPCGIYPGGVAVVR